MHFIYIFSALGGFGLVLSHRKAAVFTARRFELLELVHTTLSYLHPDSRVHSFLSPLPYQVNCFHLIDDCIDEPLMNILIALKGIRITIVTVIFISFIALPSLRYATSACFRFDAGDRSGVRS